MRVILFFVIAFGYHVLGAQQTVQLAAGVTSPQASLEDVSWIAGHWRGEAFGGIAEELWSPPEGETMMFVFRLLHEGRVSFYEIGHIKETEGTLLMQLKHFDGSLKGWEEKDETVDFKLVKIEKDKVFFEGLTMGKISDTEMHVYVLVDDGNGEQEVLFDYQKIK
ncbi:MAG: DUF6265 family protein [Bacteroidota bacterium]